MYKSEFMICSCNVYCRSKTESELEDLGVTSDSIPGIWLPFTFMYEYLMAIKTASDDKEDDTYNCTNIYMDNGDVFIIDTPYDELLASWTDFLNKTNK